MSINLKAPELRELKPRIMVCGVGGAGGNAVNNMIVSGLVGVDFVVANTDAQALTSSRAERIIQMGLQVTEGLGAGSKPEVGRAAAEEALEEIRDHLAGAHMVFVTAGMGGGTGTGAAPVIARAAREMGILTVGVVTKPFHFEGGRRMRLAEAGITELQKCVDTLIIIPNQNLFRVANEKTTFADAFAMADQVLYSGVACITDLMVKEGLINLDFADVRSIMSEMGKAMMGTGEATGERRAVQAAEAAIANPLLDEVSMKGARGLLISITGGNDLTLYEVDEAASRIRQEVDEEANIILGATFDSALDGVVRVSVVATGIDQAEIERPNPIVGLAAARGARLRARRSPRAAGADRPADRGRGRGAAPVAFAPAQRRARDAGSRGAPGRAQARALRRSRRRRRSSMKSRPRSISSRRRRSRSFGRPACRRSTNCPPVVQNQLRVHRGEIAPAPPPAETRRRSLLEKLAAFGINRNDEAPRRRRRTRGPAADPGQALERRAARRIRPPAQRARRRSSCAGPARPARPRRASRRRQRGRPARNSGVPAPPSGSLSRVSKASRRPRRASRGRVASARPAAAAHAP